MPRLRGQPAGLQASRFTAGSQGALNREAVSTALRHDHWVKVAKAT